MGESHHIEGWQEAARGMPPLARGVQLCWQSPEGTQGLHPPASARKAACTAGRRWKGRVTAARSAPSSTLHHSRHNQAEGRGGG